MSGLEVLLNDAVRMQEGALERRVIRVERLLAPRLPKLVIDRNRLMQVLVNVIKNGYEAIEELGEEAQDKVIRIEAAHEKGTVRLSITDNGIGLPSGEAASVFDLGKSRKGSSGFGLYYCKKFIEANGGSISLVSEGMEKGAMVVIELPTESREPVR